jgi:glycosyltransferase involved in cell wall biosynthesis
MSMTRVLLIHGGSIPHYRVPIYRYLSNYLKRYGFELIVVSDGIQQDNTLEIEFRYIQMRLSFLNLVKFIKKQNVEVIIDFLALKHIFMFPTYLVVKGIMKRKIIYWGQGRDLLDPHAKIKNLAYWVEQALCDAIILYAEHLKKYVSKRFQKKVFIANNTLHLSYKGFPPGITKDSVLEEYGVKTKRNIICVGRMQKRKRLDHLVNAHALMSQPDIGLILAGPDTEGVLNNIKGGNIFKLGPLYGEKKLDLLSSADVYCLPGAVGLGIVDAFYCGLPIVTEDGDESAEIMYLKNGVNGFIVPRGDLRLMSEKLMLLLKDEGLRKQFSDAARREIRENGNMNIFCSGFRKALFYATKRADHESGPFFKRDIE